MTEELKIPNIRIIFYVIVSVIAPILEGPEKNPTTNLPIKNRTVGTIAFTGVRLSEMYEPPEHFNLLHAVNIEISSAGKLPPVVLKS